MSLNSRQKFDIEKRAGIELAPEINRYFSQFK